MCGICGVIWSDGSKVEQSVRRMMRAMVHRGPDDEGYQQLSFGPDPSNTVAAFGFRRLSVLDLSPAGHQPIINPDNGDCLVFNGEIYNFRWLRARLESKGIAFRSSGDSEVLLRALSEWGDAAIAELDGMFAFAFYQAQTRRILLARDPLGIKPLYVAPQPDGLVFASEVRAVLASGLVPRDLDPAGVATVLAYGAPQDPLTVHAAIRSMPSGTFQWLGPEMPHGAALRRERRYWRFPEPIAARQEPEVAQQIRTVLSSSIRDQLTADVPIAVFLSSGIDSAIVAALAHAHAPLVRTFAVGSEAACHENEVEGAAETARYLGTIHYQTLLDDDWMASQWNEWLRTADRPSIDGFNTALVSNAAKDVGNTVALSGLGADELFGGYFTFDEVRLRRRILSRLGFIPRPLRRRLASVAAPLFPSHKRGRLKDVLGTKAGMLDLALHCRRIASDETLEQMGLSYRGAGLSEHWLPAQAYEPFNGIGRDVFRTVSQVDTFLYMGNTLLRDADTNSMANSLEIRVPFLAKAVVELVGAIPGAMHFPSGRARKHLLRSAMKDVLPAAALNRAKKGFNLPIRKWMRGPARDRCLQAISFAAGCPLLNGPMVETTWRETLQAESSSMPAEALSLVVLGNYLHGVTNMPRPSNPS